MHSSRSAAGRWSESACRSDGWGRNQELRVLTQVMYNAREFAMARMRAEADHLAADGISPMPAFTLGLHK